MALTKVTGQGLGTLKTLAGSTTFNIDSDGHITKPLQPAFLAQPSGAQSDLAVNTMVDIAFATERFDQNGDYSTPTFTAPVTGKYLLTAGVRFTDLDTASTYFIMYMLTSNRSYQSIISLDRFSNDVAYLTRTLSVVADMDASDTAKVQVLFQVSGSAQTDVDTDSFFSGCLLA